MCKAPTRALSLFNRALEPTSHLPVLNLSLAPNVNSISFRLNNFCRSTKNQIMHDASWHQPAPFSAASAASHSIMESKSRWGPLVTAR
eukprot:scaffold23841_cov67-Skeletonema_dohrnii-CCMP3373.AAC.1